MQDLLIVEYKGQAVADSRDIAVITEREHWNLVRQIKTFCCHMEHGNQIKIDSVNEPKIGLVESKKTEGAEPKIGLCQKGAESKITSCPKKEAEPKNGFVKPLFAIKEFFIESTYKDAKGEERLCFLCTRKGCDMIANKMTGEKGTLFTAAYINRFYEMERQLTQRQTPIWQDLRGLSKEIRKEETETIKTLVEYAKSQGSTNAQRYYTSLSALADKFAGITQRDKATLSQLNTLIIIERVIAAEIQRCITKGSSYKDVYPRCKSCLMSLQVLV
ncbi:MAG: Rha family transcriptional regulator [Oscillospiraceae bacterium]